MVRSGLGHAAKDSNDERSVSALELLPVETHPRQSSKDSDPSRQVLQLWRWPVLQRSVKYPHLTVEKVSDCKWKPVYS